MSDNPKGTVTIASLHQRLGEMMERGYGYMPVVVQLGDVQDFCGHPTRQSVLANLHSEHIRGSAFSLEDGCMILVGDRDREQDEAAEELAQLGSPSPMPTLLWEEWLAKLNCDRDDDPEVKIR